MVGLTVKYAIAYQLFARVILLTCQHSQLSYTAVLVLMVNNKMAASQPPQPGRCGADPLIPAIKHGARLYTQSECLTGGQLCLTALTSDTTTQSGRRQDCDVTRAAHRVHARTEKATTGSA